METTFNCDKCDKTFGSEESLSMHNRSIHPAPVKKELITKKAKKKIFMLAVVFAIVFLISFGLFNMVTAKKLPPTHFANHIEESPPSHVVREPLDIRIQRHMLEHSDGDGPPGIIINYDCNSHTCAPDLIPKLEAFAEKYPENVYVAPFPTMKAKIALTRIGRIDTLDSYDEARIEGFILS